MPSKIHLMHIKVLSHLQYSLTITNTSSNQKRLIHKTVYKCTQVITQGIQKDCINSTSQLLSKQGDMIETQNPQTHTKHDCRQDTYFGTYHW